MEIDHFLVAAQFGTVVAAKRAVVVAGAHIVEAVAQVEHAVVGVHAQHGRLCGHANAIGVLFALVAGDVAEEVIGIIELFGDKGVDLFQQLRSLGDFAVVNELIGHAGGLRKGLFNARLPVHVLTALLFVVHVPAVHGVEVAQNEHPQRYDGHRNLEPTAVKGQGEGSGHQNEEQTAQGIGAENALTNGFECFHKALDVALGVRIGFGEVLAEVGPFFA